MELYKSKNLTITLPPIVNRAYEIAKNLQGIPLVIMSNDPAIFKPLTGGKLAVEIVKPCPCGYFGSKRTPCICEADEVRHYYYTLKEKYNGIFVESCNWFPYNRHIKTEGLQTEAELLLKHAYTELDLTASQVITIMLSAKAIATMDESETIKAEHIAEAISYRLPAGN